MLYESLFINAQNFFPPKNFAKLPYARLLAKTRILYPAYEEKIFEIGDP